MKWREIGPYLRELWQRPAGPMNWKNPIRVFAVLGWLVVQGFVLLGWAGWRMFQGLMLLGWTVFRVVQFVLALPALLLFFFGGVWYAVWHFVRRPFPSLDEHPILALVQYHTPDFFTAMLWWYYLSPFVAVMLCGVISVTVWKVWLEGRRRDFAPFAKLPPWPLSADQQAPAIVIGEVHHPVEAREIFSPSWLTIPERGLYTGVVIFGAVGSGKTSACMNPFARQLLGWQAHDPNMRAAALILEVKGDFCHDIRQILVEAGRGEDYIELGMDSRSQWNPLSAWWLDSYSLAYTVSSLLNQLFGKGKEPFWQQAYTNLVRWIIELHRVFPDRWVTLQQVYRCAIDPELFAAKIEAAEKLSDDLNQGTVFIKPDVLEAQVTHLAAWDWTVAPGGQQQQHVYTRPLKTKLDENKIEHQIAWKHGPGADTRERVSSHQALVCPRLASPRQQDQILDCGGGFGVPCPCSICRTWRRCFVPPRRTPPTILKPLSCKPKSSGSKRRRRRRRRKRRSRMPQTEPDANPPQAEAAEPEPVKAAEPDDNPPQAHAEPGGIRYTWGRAAEGGGAGAGRRDGPGAARAAAERDRGTVDRTRAEASQTDRGTVDRDRRGAGRRGGGPFHREQPTPNPRGSRNHAPPTTALPIDRAGQGAGLEYARWYQPRAVPRRGRDAQERLVTGASHATGPNEGEPRQLLSARRLYL